tara:strand:+ start:1371 stop:1652 length:282 start_codon:yes stop_codon:yes gene_type:complete
MLDSGQSLFIAISVLLITLQVGINHLQLRNKSKEEVERITAERKAWVKRHPYLTMLLIFLPMPVAIFLENVLTGKSDDRNISYRSDFKEIEYD